MTEFVIRRILWIVPVVFAVAAVTFFLMHRAPGGPWSCLLYTSPSPRDS